MSGACRRRPAPAASSLRVRPDPCSAGSSA